MVAPAASDGSDRRPLVSIGLAVYNGENFLRPALDSLLAQTLDDFELIISDNASEDSTASICLEYAAADPRIRYHRNETNIGGARNENLTCELARGRYFHLAAHDDVCDPDLIRSCVAVLVARPEVVLVYPRIRKIDEHGSLLEVLPTDTRGTEATPSERLRSLYLTVRQCEIIYGVMRTSVLQASDLQRNYTDSDRTLLCQLALTGPFATVPEVLFSKRIHPEMSIVKYSEWRSRMAWFGDDVVSGPTLPNWMQLRHLLSIIRRAPISAGERARCDLAMVAWIGKERRWRRLLKDLYLAGRQTMAHRRTPGSAARPDVSERVVVGPPTAPS